MFMRKINAWLSLITTVLILDHAIFLGVWMLSRGSIPKSANSMPWILTGMAALHALVCFGFMFASHKDNKIRKGKSYPKLNASTIAQRATGVLMIVFTAPHILGTLGIIHPSKVVHGILPPLFFTVVMAHVCVSVSKAFVTLGIGNATLIKVLNIATRVICVATLIADITGFYLYLW